DSCFAIGRGCRWRTHGAHGTVCGFCVDLSESARCGRSPTYLSVAPIRGLGSNERLEDSKGSEQMRVYSDCAYLPVNVDAIWQLSPFWGSSPIGEVFSSAQTRSTLREGKCVDHADDQLA